MKNREAIIDVLLVEDEETLALIIKDTLEGQGFAIRLAETVWRKTGKKESKSSSAKSRTW